MNKKTNKDHLYQIRLDKHLKEALKEIPTAYVRLELKRIVDKYKTLHKSAQALDGMDEKDTRKILKDLLSI